jgi:hypothetical protein
MIKIKLKVVPKIQFKINCNFNHTRTMSAKSVDTQAVQTHKFPEDGQELRPKHVGAIIN